jgi:hypothetical protein
MFRNSSLFTWSLLILFALNTACEDEGRQTLETLHQLADSTPLYPGFQQLTSNDYVKTNHALVLRCYSARANYADVKSFYAQVLEPKGWRQAEEQQLGGFFAEGSVQLTFRKANFAIVLDYANLDDPSGKCNYSLAYYSNPP